jgi:hypothetical protein
MKSVLLFFAAFVIAAAATLVFRAARHEPYAEPAPEPASAPVEPAVHSH